MGGLVGQVEMVVSVNLGNVYCEGSTEWVVFIVPNHLPRQKKGDHQRGGQSCRSEADRTEDRFGGHSLRF